MLAVNLALKTGDAQTSIHLIFVHCGFQQTGRTKPSSATSIESVVVLSTASDAVLTLVLHGHVRQMRPVSFNLIFSGMDLVDRAYPLWVMPKSIATTYPDASSQALWVT